MRAGVHVLVPGKSIFRPEPLEEGFHLVVDVGLDERGSEAASVLGVVNQERGPRSAHRDQVRVVLALEKIRGRLLDFVRIHGMKDIRFERRKAGVFRRCKDAFIKRSEHDGLPPAAGKARDA